jgi:predicted dehydrogenase
MTLAVGIVGCGKVARHHIPALRAARGVELATAFDVDTEAARATGATVAGSLEELIARVDLVAVCTPPETHAAVALAALGAGRGRRHGQEPAAGQPLRGGEPGRARQRARVGEPRA